MVAHLATLAATSVSLDHRDKLGVYHLQDFLTVRQNRQTVLVLGRRLFLNRLHSFN